MFTIMSIYLPSVYRVTCWDGDMQKSRGKSIMKQLSERVFANGERNMDLLLGALTYAGWCVVLATLRKRTLIVL